mgnify:CR=1 FL=1
MTQTSESSNGENPAQPCPEIRNAMLAYISYAHCSGTIENIRRVVLGHFTDDQIAQAKDRLGQVSAKIPQIGDMPRRRSTVARSKSEADLDDVLETMKKLDDLNMMPEFSVPAMEIPLIPRIHPDDVTKMHVIHRLNELEHKYDSIVEMMSRYPFPPSLHASDAMPSNTSPELIPDENRTYAKSVHSGSYAQAAASLSQSNGSGRHVPQPRGPNPGPSGHRQNQGGRRPNDDDDDDGGGKWNLVRPQKWKRRRGITGQNKGTSGTFRAAPTPPKALFISRVNKDTQCEDVKKHIQDLALDVTIIELKRISHKEAKANSFCLTLDADDYSKLNKAELWPDGVVIRRFVPPKTPSGGENTTSSNK